MTNDLTRGSPAKIIWRFSVPLLLSTALQQVYNITDSIIVGRFTGAGGLAAIGAAYPITLFFIAVATGSGMGCSVVISQIFGADRKSELRRAITTSIISLSILGVSLSALGALLAKPLMLLLNAEGETLSGAVTYLAIYSVGVFPMLVYNSTSSVFTGLGNSRLPLYLLLASSVLNVVLDLVAVGALGMGIAGAAWATVISQAVSAILALLILFGKNDIPKATGREPLMDKALLVHIWKVALPCIFQQSCVALAHTIVQSLVNTFSTSVIAGYEAASKIHNFAYMSMNTLGTALAAFVAQNFGAKRIRRISQGYVASTFICLGLTAVVIAIMQIFPKQLLGMFVDAAEGSGVIETGVRFLRTISPDYLIICLIITTGGYLRGVGRARDFFLLTVLDFAVRVTMCFVLTKLLNSYTGLFWSWYFGSAVDCALCAVIFIRAIKKGREDNGLGNTQIS